MNLKTIIFILLLGNVAFHLLPAILLGFETSTRELFFPGLIIFAMALTWLRPGGPGWVKWPSLLIPLIGGPFFVVSRLATSTHPDWMNFGLIGFDIACCLAVAMYIFRPTQTA
ncbi:MAG: hypothetical protein AAF613_09655 [Pseudomonadota bacterium]